MQATVCGSAGQLASRCVGLLPGLWRRGSSVLDCYPSLCAAMQVLRLRGEPARRGGLQQRAATQRQGAATGAGRLRRCHADERGGALWLAAARGEGGGRRRQRCRLRAYHPAHCSLLPLCNLAACRLWRPRASSACGQAATRARPRWRSSRWCGRPMLLYFVLMFSRPALVVLSLTSAAWLVGVATCASSACLLWTLVPAQLRAHRARSAAPRAPGGCPAALLHGAELSTCLLCALTGGCRCPPRRRLTPRTRSLWCLCAPRRCVHYTALVWHGKTCTEQFLFRSAQQAHGYRNCTECGSMHVPHLAADSCLQWVGLGMGPSCWSLEACSAPFTCPCAPHPSCPARSCPSGCP